MDFLLFSADFLSCFFEEAFFERVLGRAMIDEHKRLCDQVRFKVNVKNKSAESRRTWDEGKGARAKAARKLEEIASPIYCYFTRCFSSSGLPRLRGMLRASGMGAKALMLEPRCPCAVATRRRHPPSSHFGGIGGMRRFCRSQGCCICSCLVGGTRFRPCFLFKMWSRTVMLLTCVYLRVISIKLIFFNIWRNSLFNRFVRWCSESTVILVVGIPVNSRVQGYSTVVTRVVYLVLFSI